MNAGHRELEQLSAFLDGELGDAERAAVEAHVSTCEQCAPVLDALRATTTDLRLLAEAEPTQQDAWALRSAIARARREQRAGGPRWSRVLAASSASAAVLALIVGSIVFLGGDPSRDGGPVAGGPGFAQMLTEDANGIGVEVLDSSFDQRAAQDMIPSGVDGLAGAMEDGADGAPADRSVFSGEMAPAEPAAKDESAHRGRIAACEAALFGDESGVDRQPRRYVVARYNDVDAYFLLYYLPAAPGYELWVVARADCDNVLLFEQRDA